MHKILIPVTIFCGMKTSLFILTLFFILISQVPLAAEVLSFPPITYMQPFKENESFPSLYGWFDFRHHAPGKQEISPAWLLDTGLIFTFYSWKHLAIEGMSRHIFYNRLHPDSYWIVYPLAIFTDLRLGVAFRLFKLLGKVAYHHDCKHDIEVYLGRIVIHDAVSLHLTHNTLKVPWPQHSFSTLFKGDLIVRINFTPLFQNQSVQEPDIFCITLLGEVDPVSIESLFSIFLQGEMNMISRKTDIEVQVPPGFSIDFSLKSGIRLFKREKGLTIYTELESLSDNWITNYSETAVLFSFGILFYVQS